MGDLRESVRALLAFAPAPQMDQGGYAMAFTLTRAALLAADEDAKGLSAPPPAAHARGAAKRENAAVAALAQAESTIQSFKDRLANARAELAAIRRTVDAEAGARAVRRDALAIYAAMTGGGK